MPFDPTAAASKWGSRLGQAAADGTIERGVRGVTVDPGVAAARQADVWAQNTVAAKEAFKRNVQTGLGNWQEAFLAKKDRIASGASSAQPKMEQFLTKLAPVIDQAVRTLPPRGTFEANKARASAMMDALHKAKGSFK